MRGQVALVTGGASGLGHAFASILADAGAHVVVADVDHARGEGSPPRGTRPAGRPAAAGGRPALSAAGARRQRPAAVDALADQIVATHGHLDIAFANAGVARGRRRWCPRWIDEFGLDDYDALIDVNLHGVVYTIRAAARHMKKQRSGSIVATASTAGMRNDPFVPYSYAIAKAGVINFVKQAAHDLARWNVRVNAISPGPFKTNLGGKAARRRPGRGPWSAVMPLGRMGDPAEIRGLALLLASAAGSFMTGGVYPIDGGALLQGPSLSPRASRRQIASGPTRVLGVADERVPQARVHPAQLQQLIVVPISATRPWSMTMIRSARAAVVSRCATTIVVRDAVSRRVAAVTAASDARSSAAVASSSSRMSGSASSARASAMSCRCPADRFRPPLADLVVVAAGQPRDHLVRAHCPRRRLDLGVGGGRPRVGDRRPRPSR